MAAAVLALYATYPISCEGNDDIRSILEPRHIALSGGDDPQEEAQSLAASLASQLGCHVQVWDVQK